MGGFRLRLGMRCNRRGCEGVGCSCQGLYRCIGSHSIESRLCFDLERVRTCIRDSTGPCGRYVE